MMDLQLEIERDLKLVFDYKDRLETVEQGDDLEQDELGLST